MTLTTISPFEYPPVVISRVANNTPFLLDSTGEMVAFLVRAPKTGNLNNIKFNTGVVTVGNSMRVSFQDVDLATGDPDGVVDQFRIIAIADANDTTTLTTGLITSDGTDGGAKRAVTKGDFFFIVIEFDTWVAGNLNINSVALSVANQIAYVDHFTSAAWVKSATAQGACALIYDDLAIAFTPTCTVASTLTPSTLSTSTTPDEIAIKGKFPVEVEVTGAWFYVDGDGDYDIVLYDSNGTSVLLSKSFDKDVRSSSASGMTYFYFASVATLLADTYYYLTLKPTTTTAVGTRVASVITAADLDSLFGGQTFHQATRTDAGAWTADTAKRPFGGFLVSKIHGAGGGGGPLSGPGRLIR